MKSGTKNYRAISEAIEDLKVSSSLQKMKSASTEILDSLELYKKSLLDDEVDYTANDLSNDVAMYDYHMTHCGKALGKNIRVLSYRVDKGCCDWDLDSVYQYQLVKDDFKNITKTIAMDLLYQYKFDEFKEVLKLSFDVVNSDLEYLINHFEKLREMIIEIENENFAAVLKWIENFPNKEALFQISEILQDVIILMYFKSLETGEPIFTEIEIENTKNKIDKQRKNETFDVYESLGKYDLPDLNSFNKEEAKENLKTELVRIYNKISPNVENLQSESPLYKCLLAGHIALGALLKHAKSLRRKSTMDSERRMKKLEQSFTADGGDCAVDEQATDDHVSIENAGSRTASFSTHTAKSRSSSVISHEKTKDAMKRLTIKELPIEIELPKWMSYHALYVCPVTKQVTDIQSMNEPMILPCGHVIGQQALHRLSGWVDEIKCPYCPQRALHREAAAVRFQWV